MVSFDVASLFRNVPLEETVYCPNKEMITDIQGKASKNC